MDMFCVNLIAKDLWGKNRSAYFSSSVLNDAGDKGKKINEENVASGKQHWANGKLECFKQNQMKLDLLILFSSLILRSPCDKIQREWET